jgi:hypothetical protein
LANLINSARTFFCLADLAKIWRFFDSLLEKSSLILTLSWVFFYQLIESIHVLGGVRGYFPPGAICPTPPPDIFPTPPPGEIPCQGVGKSEFPDFLAKKVAKNAKNSY